MNAARYDVADLGGRVLAVDVTAKEATRLVEAFGGAARVRFHGDASNQVPPMADRHPRSWWYGLAGDIENLGYWYKAGSLRRRLHDRLADACRWWGRTGAPRD